MHILLIHQFFLKDHEGGGARWNEMTRIWVENGHKVTVLAGNVHYMSNSGTRRKSGTEEYTSAGGARVFNCFVTSGYHSGFVGRLWGYFTFVFSALYAGLFRVCDRCDVVIVSSPPLFVGLAGWIISVVKRIPLVFEVRDLWPESAVETGVVKKRILIRLSFWLEAFLYRKADLINVLTPAFREILVNKKQINREKIILIANAADFRLADAITNATDVNEFRKKLGLQDQFVITYAGAHGIANGLSQILDAADLLRNTNAHFLIIGDGPEKADLMANARARGLQKVTFMQAVPKSEVLKYVYAGDAGLSVLKKAEIFKTVYSNKTFDYFSCRKPVLLAIDGVSRHLVESADAGIFIEPENPHDFAHKVRRYLSDPDLAARQGVNGYWYAKMHFDREDLAKQYLGYIDKIVKEGYSKSLNRGISDKNIEPKY